VSLHSCFPSCVSSSGPFIFVSVSAFWILVPPLLAKINTGKHVTSYPTSGRSITIPTPIRRRFPPNVSSSNLILVSVGFTILVLLCPPTAFIMGSLPVYFASGISYITRTPTYLSVFFLAAMTFRFSLKSEFTNSHKKDPIPGLVLLPYALRDRRDSHFLPSIWQRLHAIP